MVGWGWGWGRSPAVGTQGSLLEDEPVLPRSCWRVRVAACGGSVTIRTSQTPRIVPQMDGFGVCSFLSGGEGPWPSEAHRLSPQAIRIPRLGFLWRKMEKVVPTA